MFLFHSGMHHNSNCDSNDSSDVIMRVQYVIESASVAKKLFPKKLKVIKVLDENEASDNLNPNGGWSDLRDHVLCLNMTTLNL